MLLETVGNVLAATTDNRARKVLIKPRDYSEKGCFTGTAFARNGVYTGIFKEVGEITESCFFAKGLSEIFNT